MTMCRREPSRPKKKAAKRASSNYPTVTLEASKKPGKAKAGQEDDAVADFPLDLDLDEMTIAKPIARRTKSLQPTADYGHRKSTVSLALSSSGR